MTVNVSPTPNLPPMPSNEQELLQWAQWLSTALNNYFKIAYEDINTAGSQYLFKSVTDGVNTYTATSPDDVLTLAATGGQTISVDPATGTMTFTSAAGTGDYFEYIFKRSATAPTKPDQADGVGEASPNDWFDAPPAADGNPLWMCTAWKASDGSFASGVTEWDDPISIDGQGITVEYSIDGATLWHSEFTAGDLYMRQSVDGGDTWSSAIKIVGEDGDNGTDGGYLEYVFKRAASAPTKPNQADAIGEASPNDWFDAPPAADGNALYFCTAWKDADGTFADGVSEWTGPVQIDGIALQVEYSIDGATDWHSTFAEGDLYMRQSTDGGATWSDAIKVVGEDGEDGTGNTTYQLTGVNLAALTGMLTGDTAYVTDAGGGYFAGQTYRYDGADWLPVGYQLYATTISSGKIALTSITGDLDDLADGSLYARVSVNDISSNHIKLSQYTAITTHATLQDTLIKGINNNASLSTYLAPGLISITSTGAGTVSLDDMIKDQAEWSNDNASGLYMTTSYMGYWNTTDNVWKARIESDGDVYFGTGGVTASDYFFQFVAGTGIAIIQCSQGKIGSATDYFDITNHKMQFMYDAAYDVYSYFTGNQLCFSSAAGGTGNKWVYLESVSGERGALVLKGSGTDEDDYPYLDLTAYTNTNWGCPYIHLRRSNTSTFGSMANAANGVVLGNITFEGVSGSSTFSRGANIYAVATGGPGASSIPTTVSIVCYTGTGTATFSFASSGTFSATTVTATGTITGNLFSGSGASLTALNATNLGSGTVPQARQSATIRCGTYTGDGSGTLVVPHTLGVTPSFIMVAHMDSAYECTIGTPTGTNITNVDSDSFEVGGTSVGVGNLNTAVRYFYVVAI